MKVSKPKAFAELAQVWFRISNNVDQIFSLLNYSISLRILHDVTRMEYKM